MSPEISESEEYSKVLRRRRRKIGGGAVVMVKTPDGSEIRTIVPTRSLNAAVLAEEAVANQGENH